MCVWMSGHILKRNRTSGQNTFPLPVQSNSPSSCTPTPPPEHDGGDVGEQTVLSRLEMYKKRKKEKIQF